MKGDYKRTIFTYIQTSSISLMKVGWETMSSNALACASLVSQSIKAQYPSNVTKRSFNKLVSSTIHAGLLNLRGMNTPSGKVTLSKLSQPLMKKREWIRPLFRIEPFSEEDWCVNRKSQKLPPLWKNTCISMTSICFPQVFRQTGRYNSDSNDQLVYWAEHSLFRYPLIPFSILLKSISDCCWT